MEPQDTDFRWLLHVLGRMQRRPAMYLFGDPSASALSGFLSGYAQAREDAGLSGYHPEDQKLLDEFGTWLRARLKTGFRDWRIVVHEALGPGTTAKAVIELFREFCAEQNVRFPTVEESRWPFATVPTAERPR